MSGPIWTIRDIPVYLNQTDLDDDGMEHGNMAVTIEPSTLWIWFEQDGWTPVTSPLAADLSVRVGRLEARLACVAECLEAI
jgi:hypothetical protein